MKKCSKILSVLLMLALLISPLSVAATEEEVLQPAVSAVESENAAEEAYIVEEDESLRDEFSKHFINSDGTYTAVTYAEAVHYQDGDEWEEIDNTLVSVTENGKQVYTNRSGGIADIPKVTFQQNEADKTASISVDGYSISWNVRAKTDATKYAQYKVEEAALSQSAEVVGSNIATAAVVPESSVTITAVSEYIKANNLVDKTSQLDHSKAQIKADEAVAALPEEERKTVAEKAASTIAYNDAFDSNTNVEYTVTPTKVKEDIILETPSDITTYVTEVTAEGLTAVLNADNSISFNNADGETIFSIPAMYMYDSADAYSEDIAVTLSQTGNSDYTITIEPSLTWLNSSERVYPVTVDPTVNLNTTASNVLDTYVNSVTDSDNGDSNYVYIGNKIVLGTLTEHIAYFKLMNTPSLSNDATLLNATLKYYHASDNIEAQDISVYAIKSEWDSTDFTWETKPEHSEMDVFTVVEDLSPTYNNGQLSHYEIDLTNKYRITGNGIALKYSNNTINDYTTLFSADSSTNAPILTVTYDFAATEGIFDGGMYKILDTTNVYGLTFNSTANNTTADLDTYTAGQTNQKFYINYYGGGAYSINLYGTDKVVSTDGAYVGLYTNSGDAAQLWYIEKIGNYYTMRNKKYTTYYISSSYPRRLTTVASDANFDVEQLDVIKITNYYDNEFLTAKGSVSAIQTYVNTLCEQLKTYYEEVHDIFITYDTAVYAYTEAYTDQNRNVTGLIDHSDIIYQFYNSKRNYKKEEIPVLWSGLNQDDFDQYNLTATKKYVLPCGCCAPWNGEDAIAIFDLQDEGISKPRLYKLRTLTHEFAHAMGALTKVDDSHATEEETGGFDCCMAYPNQTIREEINSDILNCINVFCDSCLSQIIAWKENEFLNYVLTR